MVIKLENTTSHQTYEYEVVDANNGEKLYFRFDINTSDLVEGEYKLELVDNGENIATDILKIGDYNPNTIQYKKGENTYINVTLDPHIQERKKVEITAPKTVITPDAGYHSIAQVEVDAVNLYNTAYEEGNVVGFNDGKRTQKELLEQITITQNGVYNREDGYNEVIVEVPDLNGSYDNGYYDGYDVGKEDGIAEAKEIILENAQVLDITENGTYTDTDKLIKEVNVNVIPNINIQNEGIKFAYSSITEIPEWADWIGIKNMKYMFYGCSKIITIPELDTSNVTDMSFMFYGCSNLTTIPLLDASNVTNMNSMFYNSSKLITIPLLDTSNVTDMGTMFTLCSNLTSVPELDTSNVTNMSDMFAYCSKLTSLPPLNASKVTSNGPFGYNKLTNITDVGGFIDLKCSWDASYYGINNLPNLTYQSCINVLNGLYDFTGNGEIPTSKQGKLKVHQNFLDTVGDEISIGTNKGWTISA